MNQRLNQIIQTLKAQRKIHSASDFARTIGIDKADLSRMVNGKQPITQRFVGVISTYFPEIDENWFLTGEGEMLKNTSAVAENHSVSIAGTEIKENRINVNADETIASLIAEVAAQRRLTEIALQQNSDLIALLGQRK